MEIKDPDDMAAVPERGGASGAQAGTLVERHTGWCGAIRRFPPDGWAMLAVVLIVLAANLPYLLGITDPNPLGERSLIGTATPAPLIGSNTLDPTDGYITQALGHLAATDILHGRLPSWNPYEGAGMPLMAEGQSAALFPGTLLLALPNGQFYEDLMLELVAGLATFSVLRRLGVGRVAAVAGGVAFALNGAFAWLATTSFNPVAFLPLVVLGIEHAYAASVAKRRGGWWLIAVSLALSLYAGFPETAYIDGLLATAWFLWRCGCGDRSHLRPLLAKAGAGAAAGLLLSAPFLVPFLGALSHEYVGIHSGGVASALVMPQHSLPQLLLPYVYGPPFAFADRSGLLGSVWGHTGGFLAVSLVFLGALSLVSPRQRGLKLILAAWIVVVLSKVYGHPAWLGNSLLLIPGGKSVAYYRYALPAVSFALAVMAALAIDGLRLPLRNRRRTAAVAIGMLAVILLAALDAHQLVVQLNGGSSHSRWAWAQIAWALAVVAAASTVALLPGPRRIWIAAVLIVDVVLMFAPHELSAPESVRLDQTPIRYLQRHLGTGRFFTLGPVAPNYGSYWGIASLNVIDVPLPSTWATYVRSQLDPEVNPVFFVGNLGGGRSPAVPSPEQALLTHLGAYREAGVSYVLTPPGQSLPESAGTFHLVLRRPTTWIYRLSGSAPYFSTRSPCVIVPTGRLSVRLSCPHATTLLRHEQVFPGWSAQIGARSVRIHAADAIYQSVQVPPGTHTVSFSYSPPGFGWALAAGVAGAAWLMIAATGFRRSPRVKGVRRS